MNAGVAELARMIEEASGFVVQPRNYGQLAAVAREQIASLKLNGIEQYMDLLSVAPDSPEWRHLLARITVKESYLYRGPAQMAALGTTILDEFAAIRRDRRLRVWCAGCARGEEAVTLAIVCDGHPIVKSWDWSILATDVDDEALEEARSGEFGGRAVSAVPFDVLTSRFVPRGDRFAADPRLLGRITFRKMNLVDRQSVVGAGPFDIVFLRNVLIYFRPEIQRRVVQTVERSMAPDGVLFLGPSESLLSLESSLRARDLGACFCYQWSPPVPVRDSAVSGSPAPVAEGPSRGDPPDRAIPPPAGGDGINRLGLEETIRQFLETLGRADFEASRAIALTLRHAFPENPITHTLVGFAAFRLTDFEAAVLAYRGAVYLDAAAPEIRFLLAGALEAGGRIERARREFRSTLVALGSAPPPPSPVFKALGLPNRDQLSIICRKKIYSF